MALISADRVQETCLSPRTGAVTLLGAVTGYATFLDKVGDGNTCYYAIEDQAGPNWEVGMGTYTSAGNTLVRTAVLSSSNAGALVDFNGGTQNIFLTYPAEVASSAQSDQAGTYITCVAGGTSDALTATFTPAITVLTNGMGFYVRATQPNATGTPTLSVNGMTPVPISKPNAALVPGDIVGDGHWLYLQYDTVNSCFMLLNPGTGIITSGTLAVQNSNTVGISGGSITVDSLTLNGTITASNSTGVLGQVLTSGGAGLPYWGNVTVPTPITSALTIDFLIVGGGQPGTYGSLTAGGVAPGGLPGGSPGQVIYGTTTVFAGSNTTATSGNSTAAVPQDAYTSPPAGANSSFLGITALGGSETWTGQYQRGSPLTYSAGSIFVSAGSENSGIVGGPGEGASGNATTATFDPATNTLTAPQGGAPFIWLDGMPYAEGGICGIFTNNTASTGALLKTSTPVVSITGGGIGQIQYHSQFG